MALSFRVGGWATIAGYPANLGFVGLRTLYRFFFVRLNQIKLSGFKSFAEPTTFQLPGQLVGVVGPNGCGKSNIMDAVRWVLGESRASELRGESMQDVIFNGTTTRKAASRSSVELVFDNADHRAGGQWGQYAEVAVKRVLTRDGSSSYYINNQPVRRRDVQDVFLGTGLGPRAYAIIGQGTISRIIESKPEELRLFLEEAAGVSKYKERRRETENRLSDTRENLTRVDDILRELNANLDKLEKQAEVAKRFRALHDDMSLKQNQLWFFKRRDALESQTKLKSDTEAAVNALESRTADLRSVEADLEAIRQAHYAAGDEVNKAQGSLYEATAEVAKLEAEIRFVVEGRQRVEQRLNQLREQAASWATREADAQLELTQLVEKTAAAHDDGELLAAQLDEHQGRQPVLDMALRDAVNKAGEAKATVAQVQQQIQVLAANQRNTGDQMRQLNQRRDRLSADKRALAGPDLEKLTQLRDQLDTARQTQAEAEERLAELQGLVPELDAARAKAQSEANAQSAQVTQMAARMQALQALQDRVKTDSKLRPWLAKHGLDGAAPLWSQLHIEPGWESALEAAMRERIQALSVSKLDMLRAFASDAPPAKLSFYQLPSAGVGAGGGVQTPNPAAPKHRRLSDLLRIHDASLMALCADWLHGVFVADSLDEALAARDGLQAGEAIHVKSGHAVSRHSVSFYAQDSEQAGLLARAQELENLHKQHRAQTLIADEAGLELNRAQSSYAQAAQQLQGARSAVQIAQSRAHELDVQVIKLAQQAEQLRARSEQLDGDLGEIDEQLGDLQERQIESEAQFEQLDMQLADTQERHASVEDTAISAQRAVDMAREQLRVLERRTQEAQFSQRSLMQRSDELRRAVATAQTQASTLKADEQSALDELTRLTDTSAQMGLQSALSVKLQREAALGATRSQYDDLTAKLRASDERRVKFERELDPLRARITELQLKEQAARLGLEQYEQFLAEAKADLAAVEASIATGGVRLAGLGMEIERIQREIAALGAVNLAALEELTTSRERKQFLDAQNADLLDAINTLEDAIRKIDGETRELLSTTFESVNLHFGRMFPELFGGGQAMLVMTGGEILDSGVQVIAQPPGKKNQSIALLSGGEKALTAIALVFAIFQLNPAPFCLLDEVDAPLDDANTERYAKLVTKMSAETQFLFISHNKIAMEMAKQLIGVTMQEQGVSRIVAVDMEAAAELIAA